MTKLRMVIVENDEDERFFMKEGFDASGLFELMAILKNGDELEDWLAANESTLPDLILSDLNMPGKDGYDVIKMVTSSPVFSKVPVIITSTSSTKSLMDKCLQLGAAHYIVKPDTFIDYTPFAQKLHDYATATLSKQ